MTLKELIEQAAEMVGGRPMEGEESDAAYGRRVVAMLSSRVKVFEEIKERLNKRLEEEQ